MAKTSIQPEPSAAAQVDAALELARAAHSGQRRKQTGEPFVQHPIAVAELLATEGYEGDVLAAAYLHDVVEKTEVPLSTITERFGSRVAELVEALSEDPGLLAYGERKRDLRRRAIEAGRPATVIYAVDRVTNLRDWTGLSAERREAVAARLGTSVEERLQLWVEDLHDLTAADPSLPFLGEIELELRSLRSA